VTEIIWFATSIAPWNYTQSLNRLTVLDHAKQAIRKEEIEARVVALEQAAETAKSSGKH